VNEVPKKRSKAADPIKDPKEIERISRYFTSNKKYRDNLLFLLGCNCGMRCGELLSLKYGHLINPDGTFKDEISFIEEKNSKKDEKGNIIKGTEKVRTVYPNEAVFRALKLFVAGKTINLNDYVFKSESKNSSYYSERRSKGIGRKNDTMTRQAVDQILKTTINDNLGIKAHASTHLMRKTYARAVLENAPTERDGIVFLQTALGHANVESTLHYTGITKDQIRNVNNKLNLGIKKDPGKEQNRG
jgi:integrase